MAHDVVVIGSGAGGGAVAWALAEAGVKVLLLESGPAYDPSADYALHTNKWELGFFPDKIPTQQRQTFAPMQKLADERADLRSWNEIGGNFNRDEHRLAHAYHHCVGLGGSTLKYTGEAHRMNAAAMQMRTRYGVCADWPVSYEELVPFYREAERITGVSGPRNYPLPPHPMSYASKQLGVGLSKLDLGWVPNSVAAPSRPYDGRPNCNYCGNCNRGCSRTDKGSVDLTFLPKARSTGKLSIETEAHVTQIEAGPEDKVRAVQYVGADQELKRVRTRSLVVCCGAIETPRLLLNSDSKYAPEGLANDSGQVGMHFMETLHWTSSALHPDPLGSHRGHPSDAICWDYNDPDAIPGIIGGCRFSPGVGESGLNGPIAYATRVVGGWGRRHVEQMQATFGQVLSIGAIGENLTNPGSYIDLDPEASDEHGYAKARIHSHIPESEIERLAFMRSRVRDILSAAGAEKPFEELGSYDMFSSTHVFGTARMGTDPNKSVVDAFGKSHRWKNLYLADASVFPSSGGGESPALTIQALGIRTGRELAERLGRADL